MEGLAWSWRSSETKVDGAVEDRARYASGVSKTRRVLRVFVGVDRDVIAAVSVVLRCARSRDVRVKCPGV